MANYDVSVPQVAGPAQDAAFHAICAVTTAFIEQISTPSLTAWHAQLLAAYAAGKPVIVTDTGALGEAVEEGKSGLIVPPCNAPALAAAIRTLIHDPAQTVAMGEHAKHLTQTVYSWQQIATQTIQGSYVACLSPQSSQPLRPAPHNPA